jgi:hypothetical protein
MHVTINRLDGIVIIDGNALPLDLSRIDEAIAVVQWDGGRGWIEYVNDQFAPPDEFKPNAPIESIADFAFAIDAHRAEAERLSREPPFDQLKNAKLRQWDNARRLAIFAGYQSSALGTSHGYGGAPLDQIEMIAAIVLQQGAKIFCRDDAGLLAPREHSAAQIAEAYRDGRAAIAALLDRYAGLLEQIEAATTPQALDAISLA